MPPRLAFASKGRFDLLNEDGGETNSESEEEVVQPPKAENVNKKKQGKQEKQPSTAPKEFELVQPIESVDEESSKSNDIPAHSEPAEPQVNGTVPPPSEMIQTLKSAVINLDAVAKPLNILEKAGESLGKSISETVGTSSKLETDAEASPATPTPKPKKNKKPKAATQGSKDGQPSGVGSSTSLPSTSFAPSLPESLPRPTSPIPRVATPTPADQLNGNRKRPIPSEFDLDNKEVSTPPAKGVKFEDGLSPGQGREGETVIPGVGRHGAGKNVAQAVAVEAKKRSNVFERTVWTFIMVGGFFALLCAGPPYMILLVFVVQTLVYKEVTALFDLCFKSASQNGEDVGDKWNKTLNWYFFVVTNYFLYGESIIYYFKHIVFVDAYFLPFAQNHRLISFMLYAIGFIAFVVSLQKEYLREQFALFCWVHMSLLIIVVSSHFIVNNILEGMIWFFVPASLVICNDIFAYICGKTFGRTPLFKLSPKKTVEGFVGAIFCTLIFALAWGSLMMRYPYMTCPAHDLGVNVLSDVQCEPNPVFLWHSLELGHGLPSIPYVPYQIHLLIMATFASLVAPFGGFFASGFKRAFDIKDFGDSIPGHGGMTDRMDCQFIMGIFSYVYYSSLIRTHHVTVGSVMATVINSLSTQEQIEVFNDLHRYLQGRGIKL